jgi:hypothetical protein
MEVIRNNIHMNVVKKNFVTTFYVSHEGTVNEAGPAIGNVICRKERAVAEQVTVRNNQITIDGKLNYEILYNGENEEHVCCIEGESGFREVMKVPDVESGEAKARMEIISSSLQLIDGRNYIYKISVMAYITVEQLEDLEMVKVVPEENLKVLSKEVEVLEVKANSSEMFRISEQLEVPAGKPGIEKIVWKDIRLNTISVKPLDRQLEVSGELFVFLLYLPEEENGTEQWMESTLGFHGVVEMSESEEGMISFVEAKLCDANLTPVPNGTDEMKQLNLTALLKLDVKLYQEQNYENVVDLYAPNKNVIPEFKEQKLHRLLVKNQARTKEAVKIDVDEDQGKILQLCNGNARLQIENVIPGDHSIKIMGKIVAEILYISADDNNPISGKKKEVPFEHIIDAENIAPTDRYYIDWRTEQISSNLLNGKQVEVKAVVAMEVLVFREEKEQILKEVREEAIDMEELASIPLIRGYVVQQGDTLWQLAKRNRTTTEEIMEMNDLKDEELKKGDKLLIVKSCQ